ncbi:MAG TPA: GNAT family N-acetyltransferase [Polyangia bacterium]|nr:GNAT family N-acetyltransferase [Polyangia bacterium]
MPPTFRIASPEDLDALVAMMREYYAFDRLAFDEARARAAAARLLGDESLGRAWIIEAGGAAIGYAVLVLGYSLEFHGRDAFLDELYVREPHRGAGVGRAAVELLEDFCRAHGVAALHLEVERSNARAQSLYRKLGFIDHDRYLLTRRL